MSNAEFDGERAALYEEAITQYPHARDKDIEIMLALLDPQPGERILEIGGGNGLFAPAIQERIGNKGHYTVTDPSKDMLRNLVHRADLDTLDFKVGEFENIELPIYCDCAADYYNKVWSFGAFHHCNDQTRAMQQAYSALRYPRENHFQQEKKISKLVICDVFQGTPLSRYFDTFVALHGPKGHEVKFLSEEFARTICVLVGFKENQIKIVDIPSHGWQFRCKKDIGDFVLKLHGITHLRYSCNADYQETVEEAVKKCDSILGIHQVPDDKNYCWRLNWPMKAIVAEKD